MSIRIILLFAALGLALAGCTTTTPEETRSADEKTCLSYGFRRNTDALATCLQRIDLDRRAEFRAARSNGDAMIWGWRRPVILR